MKKKLLAMLSLVTILAMESVTVFATETPSPSSTYNSTTEETQNTPDSTSTTDSTSTESTGAAAIIATLQQNNETVSDVIEAYENIEPEKTTVIQSGAGDGSGGDTEVDFHEGGTLLIAKTNSDDALTKSIVIAVEEKDDVTIMTGIVEGWKTLEAEVPDDGSFKKMDDDTKAIVAAKILDEIRNTENETGAKVESYISFSYEGSTDTNGYFTVKIKGLSNEDVVLVYHYNEETNQWEDLDRSQYTVNADGSLSIKTDTQSPFIVMKFDRDVTGSVDYTTQTTTVTNTVSGDVSPKTADTEPYAAMIAMISLACVTVFARKLAKR
jgi:hypothetical protein